ncbi:MAG: tetratricopeptide repeat protein, partial [Deltaproteobacteria bacterium]
GLRYASEAGYDPHALGSFFKELLADQRINSAGVPAYMLTHPLTEDRVANVATAITSQHLKTPAGRPASGTEFPEAQAVARAIAEPADVVIGRYRRMADEKPEDAERQLLLGRVYQTVGQLEAARAALERCRALGGLDGRVERPLGTVYVALKKPAEAREALGHYLAKHPEDGWSHLQLGKALADAGDDGGALKEFQRAISCDPELDEAQRLAGVALGRRGDEAEGFYRLAVASRLRGELEQALSHFQRTKPLLDPASPRRQEVDQAIAELLPLVHERERERLERRRGPRRGVALGGLRP